MSFAHLGLMPALLANLQQLGYQQPTAVQQQAIAPVLAGKDVLAAAQTGTGKTARTGRRTGEKSGYVTGT